MQADGNAKYLKGEMLNRFKTWNRTFCASLGLLRRIDGAPSLRVCVKKSKKRLPLVAALKKEAFRLSMLPLRAGLPLIHPHHAVLALRFELIHALIRGRQQLI